MDGLAVNVDFTACLRVMAQAVDAGLMRWDDPVNKVYPRFRLGDPALTPQVQRVRAEGRVIHCGRQLATAEARLVGADGTLYAHATTTCLVFELPAPKPAAAMA